MLKSNEYSTKYLYVSTHGEVCLKSGKTGIRFSWMTSIGLVPKDRGYHLWTDLSCEIRLLRLTALRSPHPIHYVGHLQKITMNLKKLFNHVRLT